MKIVYIAGPYRAGSTDEIVRNIQVAEEAAQYVWRHGGVAVCPHKNSELFDNVCPAKVFLRGYLKLLERCDSILLVSNWERSVGTLAEIKQAMEMDIPIFLPDRRESLARWLAKPGADHKSTWSLIKQAMGWIDDYIEYMRNEQDRYGAEVTETQRHIRDFALVEAEEWKREAEYATKEKKYGL